jgi:DNA polymerase
VKPAEILQEVAQQVAACQKCQLHFSRKRAVPGEGPPKVEIMLIGEGPGFYENEQGRPFVGQAGKFLDELLSKAGVSRSEVFITNVVKCRPPGNRDPQPDELSACSNNLERQIEALNPLIIVTLGRYSMARFMPNARISDVHGQPRWLRGRLIAPMYHPAAALHQPSLKASVEADFARLPEFIKQARSSAAPVAEIRPETRPATQPAGTVHEPPTPVEEAEKESPPEKSTPGATQLSLF